MAEGELELSDVVVACSVRRVMCARRYVREDGSG